MCVCMYEWCMDNPDQYKVLTKDESSVTFFFVESFFFESLTK